MHAIIRVGKERNGSMIGMGYCLQIYLSTLTPLTQTHNSCPAFHINIHSDSMMVLLTVKITFWYFQAITPDYFNGGRGRGCQHAQICLLTMLHVSHPFLVYLSFYRYLHPFMQLFGD